MANSKATKQTRKPASAGRSSQRFTAEERAAMRERSQEQRRTSAGKANGESEVLAKIADMEKSDRVLAERFHKIVKASAPDLVPRTWYGMPAYAKDGKIICYFRDARKFKERYAIFGFNDKANLDQGSMWPVTFALAKLGAAEEAQITKLLKRAVS